MERTQISDSIQDTVITYYVTLGERKGIAKWEPRMLLSAISKNVPLSGKDRREIVKIYYLNGQNAAQTLRVFLIYYGIRLSPCTDKAVRDLIHKFKEIGCTCDRPRSGRPSVPVETVAEVHQTISTARLGSTRGVSHVQNLPNSTARKFLRSVLNIFPFRF